MKVSRFRFLCVVSVILLSISCQKKENKASAPYLKVNTLSLAEDYKVGKDSIEITSDNTWTITAPKWIYLSNSSGTAGTSRVYLNFNTNNINSKLSGDIVVTSANKDIQPVTVKITQAALVPYLNLDRSSLSEKPTGQVDSVIIDANVKWTLSVPIDATWITTRQTNEISGKTKVYFNTTPNSSGAIRTAQIKFADISNNLNAQLLSIIQLPDFIISYFYPAAGRIGSSVTIHGFFDIDPVVKLNGVGAVITKSSQTDITFTVPGSTTGKISVTSGTNTLTSISDFIVAAPGSWSKIANSFSAGLRYDFAVSFVAGDKLYYGLGTNGGPYNKDFKIYDYKTNSWSQGPQLPSLMDPRRYASAFVLGDNAYIGMGAFNGLSDWWKLDIKNNSWMQLPSYNNDGFGGTCFVVKDTAFFANPKADANLNKFNATNGTWDNVLSNFPRQLYACTFIIGSYGYIIGGFNGAMVKTGEKYDAINNTVAPIADFPMPIMDKPSFALGNFGYVLYNGSTFRYDPNVDSWTDTHISTPIFSGVYNATVINNIAYAWLADGTMYQLVL